MRCIHRFAPTSLCNYTLRLRAPQQRWPVSVSARACRAAAAVLGGPMGTGSSVSSVTGRAAARGQRQAVPRSRCVQPAPFRAMPLPSCWVLRRYVDLHDRQVSAVAPLTQPPPPPPPPLPPLGTQGLLDNPWVKSGIISGSLSLAGDVLAQLLTQRGQQQQVGGQGAGAGGRGYAASHSAGKLDWLTLMLGGCCLAGLKQQRLRCGTSSAHGHLWPAVLRPLPGARLPLTAAVLWPAVLARPPSQQLAHQQVLPLSPCRPATGNSALITTAAGRPLTCCSTGGTACWRAPSPALPSQCLQPRRATGLFLPLPAQLTQCCTSCLPRGGLGPCRAQPACSSAP